MREVSIKNFSGVRIGNAENAAAGTGCTVFIFPEGESVSAPQGNSAEWITA